MYERLCAVSSRRIIDYAFYTFVLYVFSFNIIFTDSRIWNLVVSETDTFNQLDIILRSCSQIIDEAYFNC